jgi:hypothetical protein
MFSSICGQGARGFVTGGPTISRAFSVFVTFASQIGAGDFLFLAFGRNTGDLDFVTTRTDASHDSVKTLNTDTLTSILSSKALPPNDRRSSCRTKRAARWRLLWPR